MSVEERKGERVSRPRVRFVSVAVVAVGPNEWEYDMLLTDRSGNLRIGECRMREDGSRAIDWVLIEPPKATY